MTLLAYALGLMAGVQIGYYASEVRRILREADEIDSKAE